MMARDEAIRAFVHRSGWGDASIGPLAGDASNRRYLRLTRRGQSAVLMDAPPDKGEDVRPFMRIARLLTKLGLSAPEIHAADEKYGLLLLEDLGDQLFARIIPGAPEIENTLYTCATDLLVNLHQPHEYPALDRYDVPTMVDNALLVCTWYLSSIQKMSPNASRDLKEALYDALQLHAPDQTVLVQRDYHSENLLWLPDRKDIARVGLLDFQDAMLGHPAYDLVSLLQDARRDVPADLETRMIDRYVANSGLSAHPFKAAYHVLGAQRNLRIMGVFARLSVRDGKPLYLRLMPRVWGLLNRCLDHPSLGDLAQVVRTQIPEPDPDILFKLKNK